MLRISTIECAGGCVTLKLEGRLVGPWVEELRNSCEAVLGEGRGVTLDLADVSFVDRAGVSLVSRLTRHEVALMSCSPFVAEQLRAGAGSDEDAGGPG